MRYSQRRKRNYIIVGLCMVLAVMAVSYAAFSQQLTINSSAGTTTKWCLGFDTTVTGNVSATAGLTGATAPTGTITYNGNTCDGNYNSGASLASTLHQPGDTVTYTLTIKNSSTIDAAINSITVNNQNTVSDKDVKIGNIVFVVGMPESTSLSAGSSTTMTVTAKFQDETDITGSYSGENASITVNVNASQDGGSGGFEKKFSGTIYRNSTETWNGTTSISAYSVYHITGNGSYNDGPPEDFDNIDDCETAKTTKYNNWGSCEKFDKEGKIEGVDYVKSASLLNKTYYLKYDVEDDIIISSYACLMIRNEQYCIKKVSDNSTYLANRDNVLKPLKDAGIMSCSRFDNDETYCTNDEFGFRINNTNELPNVVASASPSDNTAYCYVDDMNNSACV